MYTKAWDSPTKHYSTKTQYIFELTLIQLKKRIDNRGQAMIAPRVKCQ